MKRYFAICAAGFLCSFAYSSTLIAYNLSERLIVSRSDGYQISQKEQQLLKSLPCAAGLPPRQSRLEREISYIRGKKQKSKNRHSDAFKSFFRKNCVYLNS